MGTSISPSSGSTALTKPSGSTPSMGNGGEHVGVGVNVGVGVSEKVGVGVSVLVGVGVSVSVGVGEDV